MDPTLKIALVAAASALAGGLITGIIAPHVAWGIEKRRLLRESRKQIIQGGRRIVVEYRRSLQTTFGDTPLGTALARDGGWVKIKPLVDDEVWQKVDEASKLPIRSNEALHALALLEEDINRLEKYWKLV